MQGWQGVIYGEPASKANSRQIVMFGKRPAVIKSQKARDYVAEIKRQVTPLKTLLTGDLLFACKIYYASRRPDLDESIILDGLQGLIYKNDRQVKKKLILWGLDREKPRTKIAIFPAETDISEITGVLK